MLAHDDDLLDVGVRLHLLPLLLDHGVVVLGGPEWQDSEGHAPEEPAIRILAPVHLLGGQVLPEPLLVLHQPPDILHGPVIPVLRHVLSLDRVSVEDLLLILENLLEEGEPAVIEGRQPQVH